MPKIEKITANKKCLWFNFTYTIQISLWSVHIWKKSSLQYLSILSKPYYPCLKCTGQLKTLNYSSDITKKNFESLFSHVYYIFFINTISMYFTNQCQKKWKIKGLYMLQAKSSYLWHNIPNMETSGSLSNWVDQQVVTVFYNYLE